MIVKEVQGKDKLVVIHYYSDTGDGNSAAIVKQEYTTDHKEVQLIEYDPGKYDKIFTGDEAIARAEGSCGTGEGEYSLIFNNCEHFCTSVKTDKKESKQVQRGVKVVLGAAVVAGLGIAAGTVLYAISKPTKPEESAENSTGKPSDPQDDRSSGDDSDDTPKVQ